MTQRGELAFLPYLLLGKLAAAPALHLQLVVLFHLFRVAVTPLTVFAIYRFSTLFINDVGGRRWVTLLATLGGGLGWVLFLFGRTEFLGSLPLEFISPETFGFLAFLGLPHLILARGLMLIVIHRYMVSGKAGSRSWRSGMLLLALTLVQSLSTLSVYAVLFVHQALLLLLRSRRQREHWRENWLPAGIRAVLPSLPLILYYIYRFSSDPFLVAWTAQNQIRSPHPIHYLLAYGVIGVPVLYAISKKPWRAQPEWILLVGWVLALPVLAYFPHNLQRRLVEGIWIALLILAAYGFHQWGNLSRSRTWIRTGVTATALISSSILFAGSIQVAFTPAAPAYVRGEQATAFQWLADNVVPGSVILAEFATGNALPAWAPMVVPIGHGPESVGLDDLKPQVEAVYRHGITPEARLTWLQKENVEYVYYGEGERALGIWDPEQESYLSRVYQSANIRIYEVIRAED
jgi:hypothetical protein